uniref:hypothetical protein n=1 Tax=Bradyrhizobium sp. (strain ORS 278) TaxID=114615 RepID=UPI0012FF3393|nr:hypothetical protein [Bradyrhizobium sp. ORS 278]
MIDTARHSNITSAEIVNAGRVFCWTTSPMSVKMFVMTLHVHIAGAALCRRITDPA